MNVRVLRGAVAVVLVAAAFAASASPAAATPPPRLLATYQPVTFFHPDESFLPMSVQSFIADADLEQRVGATWTLVDADPEPGELPASGTWRLNQDSCTPAAPLGGLTCYAAAAAEGDGGLVVYGHVVHDAGRIVLQYWYFYYDDVYSYPFAPTGAFWQAHEGDWEVVNVVLSEDEQPLFVGYSQHCLGQQRAWANTTRVDATHPVVYVARGSHANYFSPGLHPFDRQCVPLQVQALLARFGLPFPADVVEVGGASAGPPGGDARTTTVHAIDDDQPPWVSFPGFWGQEQYFHAPDPIGSVPLGDSAQGPAFHAVWTHPLATLGMWPSG